MHHFVTSKTKLMVQINPSKGHLSNSAASHYQMLHPPCSRAALNTDPSLVLCVYVSLCHWCGFSTPEQAQGFSHRKVSVVLLSSSSPMCLLCMCVHAMCMCAHRFICRGIHKPLLRLCTFMYAWVCSSSHALQISRHSPGLLSVKTGNSRVYSQAFLL